jgi:signal transduction histidine kinase
VKLYDKIPSSIKISFIYVTLGALWILFSDKMLHSIVSDPIKRFEIEVYKGWFFVAVTGIMLFFLIKAEMKKRNLILQELRTAKLKAEESDKLKTAFLANVSHYLRTPMNSILGFVDLLQNRNLDPKKQEVFLSIINEQSNHLLLFINNIIEISKLQGGQTIVNITEFSLNELMRKMQLRYQAELDYMKKIDQIQLKGVYERNDTLLKNDAEKLEYILTNLITNAIKFTKKGEIQFGYRTHSNDTEFFVIDTGSGIPAEKQELITKTFMLSDPEINKENIGVGLGLAITNGLVKLLNGRLWLVKSDSSGSEFRFVIPKLVK